MGKTRHTVALLIGLIAGLASAWGQVSICYDFEGASQNSRPMGWGALPNLDYHYVGVSTNPVHTGSKALYNNGTTCFAIMPDEGLDYGADSVWLTFWYYLHNNTDYFDVGYLTDATDSTTFHLLTTVHEWSQEWHFCAVDLSSVPTGARIAFFGHDILGSDGTFWLDDMHLTSSPCAAWGLRVAENREDSVRLEWESVGDPTVTLTINWSTTYDVTGNSFTFARDYYNSFMSELIAQCPYSGCMPIQPHSNMYIPRYREGACLDVTDVNSTMATPYYGTPVEPYLHLGTYTTSASGVSGIYAGSHTLNTNPGSDGGGMMVFPRTIPPGDNVTLRLGNRLGDWESASMLYTITVDTNETDLLVMKYTLAMAFGTFTGSDEVHHNDTLHPSWFSIEMMDDTMAQLQPEACNRFYIDMWDTAGWDEMNSMYKRRNFTGMAIDLSPYHGRRLHLRVTATDGAVNNRWCYGYYNFDCLKRHEYADGCSDGDSITFTMPYGFRYRWWKSDMFTIIDTTQSLTVAPDSSQYFCDLIDRFDPACSITVSRWALPRPQRWESDTVVENQLPYTWHGIVFEAAGDTSIILASDNGGCDTTLHFSLHVWPNQDTVVERRVCPGDWPVDWEGYTFNGPDSISFTTTDSHGADSTVTLVAIETSVYEVSDSIMVCPGNPFVYEGIDYGGPTAFDTLMTSVDGCDSLVHVALVERDSTFSLHALHSIDGITWADTIPIVLCSNQTMQAIDSTYSEATWLWTIDNSNEGASGQLAEWHAGTFACDTTGTDAKTAMPCLHTIKLVVTSPEGCTDSLQWSVVAFPAPQADFIWNPDNPADISPEVQLINYSQPWYTDIRSDDSAWHWLWLVQGGESGAAYDSLTGNDPIYRWPDATRAGDYDVSLVAYWTQTFDYQATGTDSTRKAPDLNPSSTIIERTCTDTAQHAIQIVTAWLDFPNLVTPNGDGVNDRWEVVNLVELGQYPINELWIYDAWGVQVFHARNISSHEQFWDPNERHCPDGTYYFLFTARSAHGLVRRNGVIEVLR